MDRPVTGGEVDQCRIEARKVARLRHPNIVSVHDVGRDGSNCFIVGEWIEGTNLSERIKTTGVSVVVFNPLSWTRDGTVSVDVQLPPEWKLSFIDVPKYMDEAAKWTKLYKDTLTQPR